MQPSLPGKRKRPAAPQLGNGNSNGRSSSSPPPRNNGSLQHSSASAMSSLLPNPPLRLNLIPDMVEDLSNIISLGGCPRCGKTEVKRSDMIRDGNVTVQYYTCKECSMNFHFRDLKMKKNGNGNNNGKKHEYRDCTFEGKQKLQALFRHAYGEIVKREMENDKLEFEQKIRILQSQLREKRRKISRLLDIPLLQDDDGGSETNIDQQVSINGNSNGKERDTSKDPFQETILLLRHETPKLEQRVSRQLNRHRNKLSLLSSPTISVHESPTTRTMARIEENEFVSIVDTMDNNRIQTLPPAKPDRQYQLSSRIIQDGGDEIEIYEKCSVDDDL